MSFLRQIKYKDKSGKVIPMSIKVDAANVQEDSGHRFITDTDKNNFTAKMNTNGNASNTTATFTAASTRANITSGEKLSVIFGKIAKYFADLKAVAFTGSYSDLSNKPTIPTVPGSLKNPYALKLNGKTYDGSVATDAGTMGVAYGGTGATTAANARTNLGLGSASTNNVANNLTTTAAGSVLDARQGKALKDTLNNSIGTLTTRVNECFQSASSGKSKIAAAITGKGINTAANASWDTMANNIGSLGSLPSPLRINLGIGCGGNDNARGNGSLSIPNLGYSTARGNWNISGGNDPYGGVKINNVNCNNTTINITGQNTLSIRWDVNTDSHSGEGSGYVELFK